MHKELLSKLIKSFEEDYNNDLDLFLNDIRNNLENYQTEKKLQEKKPTSSNAVIKISNLSKEYSIGKERIKALQNINLEIYEGEIVALVGPSGSGKSTLLNIIGGLDTDISGDISIASKSLKQMDDTTLSSYRNQTIGFIFQFFNLQPYLNIQENVEIPLLFRGEKEEIRSKASNEAVSSVGLSERINHLPNQLSGGQMQRVAIARAIVNQPKIILADEPTGNLDRNTGIEIVKLIKQINKDLNTTVVIVTHDNFVANQADRIIKLSDGKLV